MKGLIAVGMTIGLGLLPVPLDAATKNPPASTKPAVHGTAPAQKSVSKNRILRIRHLSGKSQNPQQSAQGRSRREAAALRRLILMRQAMLGTEQPPRLLDSGKIRSIDGDTFAYGLERIRIRGINAPETTDIGGADATQRLDALLHEGPVIIVPHGEDAYGRTLADVFVKERNLAEVMKEEGHRTKQ